MKLIHCSDLHLDSRMETNLSPEKAGIRKNEILNTFVRLTKYAREEAVAAVLICGDVFDAERVSKTTVDVVLEAISSAPGTMFFLLRGNHDKESAVFADKRLPENLTLFSDEWKYAGVGCVKLAGIEFTGRNFSGLYEELRLSPDNINIVMMHGQVSAQPGEENICLPWLKGKNIDYLALGHIHSFDSGSLDARGTWVYSGTPEGRGFDECGEKGFVEIDIPDMTAGARSADGANLKFRFVPFASRTLLEVPVDVTGCESVTDIRREMERCDAPASSLVRFVLVGNSPDDFNIDTAYLESALAGKYFFMKIKDRTRLAINPKDFENDITLKGEFIRRVYALDMDDEDRQRVLRLGISALSGEEIAP